MRLHMHKKYQNVRLNMHLNTNFKKKKKVIYIISIRYLSTHYIICIIKKIWPNLDFFLHSASSSISNN